MAQPKQRIATYADIVALPSNIRGEIVAGVLHAHPRPNSEHGIAASELGAELIGPFRRGRGGPGGWVFIIEPELHFGDDVVVPDIAGWRIERLSKHPKTPYIETPPDWLCEVMSPSTQRFDRIDKLRVYARVGVHHCWYVDPRAKTLEVFALVDGKWQIAATFQDGDMVKAPPFEVHEFPLAVLWPLEPAE